MTGPNGYNPLTTMGPQGRWRRVLLITLVPMVVIFLYFTYSSNLLVMPDQVFSQNGQPVQPAPQNSIPQLISESILQSTSQSTPQSIPQSAAQLPSQSALASASQPSLQSTLESTSPSSSESLLTSTLTAEEKAQSTASHAHELEHTPDHINEQKPKQKPEQQPEKKPEKKPEPKPEPNKSGEPPATEEDLSMATVIKALYKPILHPIDAANFTDEDGDVHSLAGEPTFREKLGKKVLILDIDSRPLTGEGQLMNEELNWKGMRPLSAGMLSHYMFAMIHGYDYQFIRAPDYPDRWGTWVKVPLMKHALKSHDYIVFMDSDVMFHYPHLPLEWLLNYWNMTNETLAMMSIDPDEPQNYDQKGNRYLNTGFVIARQSERTQEMYKAWAECPSEKKYKGCAHWGLDWAHEQAAFGNYLRYDFDRPEDFRVLPCAEANGAPEAINRGGCKGTFVRHFWVDKGLLSKGLSDSVMQYFLPRLHQMYHQTASQHIMDAKGYKLVGADLVEMTEAEKAKLEEGKNQKDEGF